MAALRSRMRTYIFSSCGFSFLSPFLFPCLISAVGHWISTILPHHNTWCGLSVNLECMSEMCCMRLAENTGCKNSPSGHHCTTLSGYISATKACIDNRKKLVKQQYLPRMSLQYSELGPLAAEIASLVWGTPANFNGFRVLAALLHGTPAVGVSQTLRC